MRWIVMITLLWGSFVMVSGVVVMADEKALSKAYFAGGCFWCMEAEFEQAEGVSAVTSGYMGGTTKNPTYREIGSKKTGHFEAVEVVYNPSVVTYKKLLEIYWSNIDPLDAGGQFNDRGSPYYTAIFTQTDAEKSAAENSKDATATKLKVNPDKIATQILPYAQFYIAEEHHQDYYKKNATHYNLYKYGSGRVSRLKELWKE